MKKIILGMSLLSTVALATEVAPTNVYLRAGVDTFSKNAKINVEGQDVTKKNASGVKFEIAVEATENITKEFELGMGIAYQNHGKIKVVDESKESDLEIESDLEMPRFHSVPVYLVGKYNIPVEGNIKPYLKADLGYSFNLGEIDNERIENGIEQSKVNVKYQNGAYWGIGAGVEYNNFVVDVMYKVNCAKAKISTDKETFKDKVNYERVTLGFGYKFNY